MLTGEDGKVGKQLREGDLFQRWPWGLLGGFCSLGDVWALHVGAGCNARGEDHWMPSFLGCAYFFGWVRGCWKPLASFQKRCWLHDSQLIFSQERTGVMDTPEKVLNWLGTSYPWEHLWHLVCFKLLRWGSGWQLPWSRLVTGFGFLVVFGFVFF